MLASTCICSACILFYFHCKYTMRSWHLWQRSENFSYSTYFEDAERISYFSTFSIVFSCFDLAVVLIQTLIYYSNTNVLHQLHVAIPTVTPHKSNSLSGVPHFPWYWGAVCVWPYGCCWNIYILAEVMTGHTCSLKCERKKLGIYAIMLV